MENQLVYYYILPVIRDLSSSCSFPYFIRNTIFSSNFSSKQTSKSVWSEQVCLLGKPFYHSSFSSLHYLEITSADSCSGKQLSVFNKSTEYFHFLLSCTGSMFSVYIQAPSDPLIRCKPGLEHLVWTCSEF